MFPIFALILVGLVSKGFALPRLVILSFDGFHPSYISREKTPYLYDTIRKISAGPPYMTSIFPSKAFVTHFSVSTGVRTDVHGVYGNKMFDTDGKEMFNEQKQFQTDTDIIPIWIENQDNDGYSATMMWPGAEYEYSSKKATYNEVYDDQYNFEWRGRKILRWMNMDRNKPNLVMAYFEYNPCNDKTKQTTKLNEHLTNVDDVIRQVHRGLQTEKVDEQVDLIIISANGTETIPSSNIMKINDYITDTTENKVIVAGPVVFIKPPKDKFETVLNSLKTKPDVGMTYNVYSKDTFNSDHKMNSKNLEDIIIMVARPGYTFCEQALYDKLVTDIGGSPTDLIVQENGYDTESINMRGIFLATGKTFRENITTISSFNIMEVYPLLRKLLGLSGKASDKQDNITISNTVHVLFKEFDVSDIKVPLFTENSND